MSKRGVVVYLHVHQPWRIKNYSIFDTATDHQYFNDDSETDRNNQKILRKVADKSYRPMNALLRRLLDTYPEFKFSLSITGTLLEQAEAWAPDVIEDFRALVATGRVELVAETYYHSLAFFYSREEFERQVDAHAAKIEELFGVKPTAFRNTELAYNDELAKWADTRGYKAILAEGWDSVLSWRSSNFVYHPAGTRDIKLLLKNYRLSDDLAFRFSDKAWEHFPLHANKYSDWIDAALGERGEVMNLFMDYETFGENVWEDTGIFDFFSQFVDQWLSREDHTFYTVTEATETFESADEVSMPNTVTWADSERDLTAWLGNSMQQESMKYLYELENDVMRTGDESLIADWRKLTTSDHPYYMCTKWSHDGDVHAYFSPYDSPYDAFLYYMNALRDVRYRLMEHYHHGGL
jgi:alpha-amylase